MSEAFKIVEFPGRLEEVTVKTAEGKEKQCKAVLKFEDSEWEIKVTVKPKYEDLFGGFIVGMPYYLNITPVRGDGSDK